MAGSFQHMEFTNRHTPQTSIERAQKTPMVPSTKPCNKRLEPCNKRLEPCNKRLEPCDVLKSTHKTLQFQSNACKNTQKVLHRPTKMTQSNMVIKNKLSYSNLTSWYLHTNKNNGKSSILVYTSKGVELMPMNEYSMRAICSQFKYPPTILHAKTDDT